MLKNTKSKSKQVKKDFTVDGDLNKYQKMDLFKDKVEKTNNILKTGGLPKEW